jgi:AcrR family transcriptional regulator
MDPVTLSQSGVREPAGAVAEATSPLLGRPVGSKGEDTRRRIIAATMQCVAEMGYARATIREIARAADMTSGSLYHYFPNKAELVKAAYLEAAGSSMPQLSAAAAQADDLVDKLVAVLHQSAKIVQAYPHAIAFDQAVRAAGVDEAVLSQLSSSIFASLRAIVASVIRQAHKEGKLTPDMTPEGAINAVFSIMRGLQDDTGLVSPADFQDTVRALRLLLQGRLTGEGVAPR